MGAFDGYYIPFRGYFPPPEAIVRMAEYCNKHGRPTERPYFSLDGHNPVTE